LRRVVIGLLVFTLVEVGRHLYKHHEVVTQLQEAVAELDRTDPGWRIENIEAARIPVSDAENGALCVVAAAYHLPNDWPPWEIDGAFRFLEPPEQLAPDQFALLCRRLKEVDPALKEARKLADRPSGRHEIHYVRNVLETVLNDQQEARRVNRLLVYEAVRQAQAGDIHGALTSCRAALNAARSIGDEPLMITQMIRTAGVCDSCRATERVLAQGEPMADDLERMQRALEDEDRFPEVLVATRGERAILHQLLDDLESDSAPPSPLAENGRGPRTWQERFFGWIGRDKLRTEHVRFMSLMTRRIEELQLPMHEQPSSESLSVGDLPDLSQPSFLRLLLPALEKFDASSRRKHAFIRCAAAALAAERYRRRHGAWPKSLEELTSSKMLSAVPLDPFDGEPLRYRRLPAGVVLYSIGPDREDNEGTFDRENPTLPGTDVGFQLWDLKHRRQPPRPAPPAEPPAEPE
jgi:hypothetical protein